METPKTILEDILETCRGIKEIDILGTKKTTSEKVTPNEAPLLAVNGVSVIKIIRRAIAGGGEEILESIDRFHFQNSDRIAETSSYLFLDQQENLYELRKYNSHSLKLLDNQTKEEYLKRII